MLNKQMYEYGSKSSVIRELFAYGLERKKIVGDDKVYDFRIGNPSIPAPEEVKEALENAENGEEKSEKEKSPHGLWECKLLQPLWKYI